MFDQRCGVPSSKYGPQKSQKRLVLIKFIKFTKYFYQNQQFFEINYPNCDLTKMVKEFHCPPSVPIIRLATLLLYCHRNVTGMLHSCENYIITALYDNITQTYMVR